MKNQNWRKIQIFVSSTFKDMDAERDALKLNVCRRLNERYRGNHLEFQFVDLRLGINTEGISENEAENKVLDICFDSIERTRPFFIGLIGDRYGWIPSADRWMHVASKLNEQRRTLIKDGVGLSVTELEILFGAIGNDGQFLSHSLFYFRDSSSYAGMTQEMAANFRDDADKLQLLDRLKTKISDIGQRLTDNNLVTPYKLTWNPATGRFEGISHFEDMVYEHLCREIDSDLSLTQPIRVIDSETLNTDYLLHTLAESKPHTDTFTTILDLYHKHHQVLIYGYPGSGRSTLLAQLNAQITADAPDALCLTAFIGTTPLTTSINGVLSLLTYQIRQRLGNAPEDVEVVDDYSKAVDTFRHYANEARRQGIKIVVFLDNIEYFGDVDLNALYLTWLDKDMDFIGTVTKEYVPFCKNYNSRLQDVEVPPITASDTLAIIHYFEENYNIALPANAVEYLINTSAYPYRIALLVLLVSNFTAVDIAKIKEGGTGSDIGNINNYILRLMMGAPNNPDTLPTYIINSLIKQLRAKTTLFEAFRYIALSEIGLDYEILETLCGPIDQTALINIAYLLSDFILENKLNHRWYYRDHNFGDTLLPDNRLRYYKKLYQMTAQMADDAELRQAMLPYFAIKAHASGEKAIAASLNHDEAKQLYGDCIHIIQRDAAFIDDAVETSESLTLTERINLVYNIYCAIDNIFAQSMSVAIADRTVLDQGADTLDAKTCYNIGLICIAATQLLGVKHLPRQAMANMAHDRDFYLAKAVEYLKRCYTLDPEHRDIRNMLKVALMNDADRIMKNGNWDEIEQYYNYISTL